MPTQPPSPSFPWMASITIVTLTTTKTCHLLGGLWDLLSKKWFWGAKFWLWFCSRITADWGRTSGCLHGRALDTVICVALYQGFQIFAGRFGGKCLDQCKHCRPRRNPTGSKDHSRSPAPILTVRKPSESPSGQWAHWRDSCRSKSAKGSRFYPHQLRFFHKYEWDGPGSR